MRVRHTAKRITLTRAATERGRVHTVTNESVPIINIVPDIATRDLTAEPLA